MEQIMLLTEIGMGVYCEMVDEGESVRKGSWIVSAVVAAVVMLAVVIVWSRYHTAPGVTAEDPKSSGAQ